ncbi:MAG TPA: sugar ABC transporter permease [Chthoniobacteraceae bacterium]|nr:sugar ABC transporter permease [Chthoniobacteraceae bacterium]
MTTQEKRNLRIGLLFISPWIAGFLIFMVYPVVSSLILSLCDYSLLSPAVYVGGMNYHDLLTDDVFWKALGNTFFFAAISIPLGFMVSLSLAILLSFDIPCRGIFRTLFFLPSLVPVVSLAVLWEWMLNGNLGPLNHVLAPVLHAINALCGTHLAAPNWLQDARYAKWGLIFTGLWGSGNAMVIYLAALQDVPRHFYESADIDGANFRQKTWHITLPMISPVIYFNVIMSLIGSLQVFAVPYVMAEGQDGPERSLLFISTYLYHNAFDWSNTGYACAIGVMLFLIILFLTLLATRISRRHIYYAGK